MAPAYADHPFSLLQTPRFRKGNDTNLDIFDECASAMATIHNVFLRGLNAIYLQAQHVNPPDEKSFCAFISNWYSIIKLHHAAEEEDGFPLVEKMAGEKGIMDANVEQHNAFLGGLGNLGRYVGECVAGREEYDGTKVVEMIDGFGAELAGHLRDEIPTIEELRRYGAEKMAGLKGVLEAEAERNKRQSSLASLCVLLMSHDVNYEDGLWADWPPMPGAVKLMCRNVLIPWHADMLKFAPSDKNGKLRPLYAVGGELGGNN